MAKPPAITQSRVLGPDGKPLMMRNRRTYGGRNGGRYGSSGGLGGFGTRGGLVNQASGLGGNADKSATSFFQPTLIWWRSPLEILYVQSWAAKKSIDIPVDDMFLRWREWKDDKNKEMEKVERDFMVRDALSRALRAASLFGSSCLVMVTKEAPLETPLDMDRIRPGDLVALHVFDRFDMSIVETVHDPLNPMYGKPAYYRITPRRGGGHFNVHSSRCIRFDAIDAITAGGFEAYYDQDWGVSDIIPILISLVQDQILAGSIAHLSQEASIPVLKVDSLAEKAAGMTEGAEEQTIDQIGARFNEMKSIFNLMMIEKEEEEFERVAVQFGGLADLMDRFPARLAMARDIPQTRFMGNPPTGMNATGESDMRNYVMMVEAKRAVRLAGALPKLDDILARNVGMKEAPEYEWPSLIEMSDQEKAMAAKTLMEAFTLAISAAVITEEEVRKQLDGHPVFGSLPDIDLDEQFEKLNPAPPMPPGAEPPKGGEKDKPKEKPKNGNGGKGKDSGDKA